MQSKTCKVSKISCGHCVNTIQTELREIPGILEVTAESEKKYVSVKWDESILGWSKIVASLDEIGFPPDKDGL